LANVVMAIVNKGDDVVIPTPYWVTYSEIVKLAEGNVVLVRTSIENKYKRKQGNTNTKYGIN